jgi:hypothetical protein
VDWGHARIALHLSEERHNAQAASPGRQIMKRIQSLSMTLSLTALCFGIGALAGGQPVSPSIMDKQAAAQSEVLRLGNKIGDPDVAELAKRIVKDHDSEDISSVFKKKMAGGLGIGKLTQVDNMPDGIQPLMMRLERRKNITEAELEKYSEDYVRVAKVLQAMAELAPYRASQRVSRDPKLAKEWQEVAQEFKTGATRFRKAVDGKDPKMLRVAAATMNNTCCHCHELADR